MTYTKVYNETNCNKMSMSIVVVYWRRHRTIDLEGLSSSIGKCIVQFFFPLLYVVMLKLNGYDGEKH